MRARTHTRTHTHIGAYFGFRKSPITLPVRTNQIPRQVCVAESAKSVVKYAYAPVRSPPRYVESS